MMYEGLKSVRRQRAMLERDRVMIGSMLEDTEIADAICGADNVLLEGVSDAEIEELLARIPESDEEDAQVDRILSADGDINIDAIFGLEPDEFELDDDE